MTTVNLILALPVITGAVLIITGILIYINRTKFGIHTVGTVTGMDKLQRKQAKLQMNMESPVVKYTVKNEIHECPASKYLMEGVYTCKKGDKIDIRVSRKNHRKFQPVKNGGTSEKILICCGTFMIIACIVMYFRYF